MTVKVICDSVAPIHFARLREGLTGSENARPICCAMQKLCTFKLCTI